MDEAEENGLTAVKNGSYLDLYLDGKWIADIHVEPDGRIGFFTGELDTMARKGGTASAMLIIGGTQLVEIRHDLEYKASKYAEAVFDEETSNE
jgi:hypothetical protein